MPPTPDAPLRRFLRLLYWISVPVCLLVPVALFVFVVMCVQSSEDLRNPPRFPYPREEYARPAYYLGELFYDENDLSAYVLRGLNAHLGRDAGYRVAVRHVGNDTIYSELIHARDLDSLLDAETDEEDPHFVRPSPLGKWAVIGEDGEPRRPARRLDLFTRYPDFPERYRAWLPTQWPEQGSNANHTRRLANSLAEALRHVPTVAEVRPGQPRDRLPAGLRDGPPEGWQLRDRYYLEYPHAALWLFQAGWLIQPGTADLKPPPYLLDGSYLDMGWHAPEGPEEAALWRHFVVAARFYMAISTACLLGLMAVLLAGYEPGRGLSAHPAWLLLPAVLYFTANRFDVIPALLTGLMFLCVGRGRPGLAGGFLAAGALIKVYPVLLVPVVLRYLGVSRGTRFLAGFAGTSLAVLGLSALVYGPGTVLAPYSVQLGRLPEIGGSWEDTNYTFYRYLLPESLAYGDEEHAYLRFGPGRFISNGSLRLGLVGLLVLGLCVTRPPDLASVLRRSALVLVGFVSLAVFFSPQWIVWLLPMLVPLASRRGHRPVAAALIVFDLLTYFTFPFVMLVLPWMSDDLLAGLQDRFGVALEWSWLEPRINLALVYTRAVVLGWLSFALLLAEGDGLLPGQAPWRRVGNQV
jgi:hypothetical protein